MNGRPVCDPELWRAGVARRPRTAATGRDRLYACPVDGTRSSGPGPERQSVPGAYNPIAYVADGGQAAGLDYGRVTQDPPRRCPVTVAHAYACAD